MARPSCRQILLTLSATLLLGACSASAAPAQPAAVASGGAGAANPVTSAAPAGSAPAQAGTTDACALLTQAEVAAAFKETMLKPVGGVKNGSATCAYTHEAGGLDLTVEISSRPSSVAAIKGMETIYGSTGTDVPDVGDAAFEFSGILEFVKGTTLVTIGTGDGPAIISPADFTALTKLAAGRV